MKNLSLLFCAFLLCCSANLFGQQNVNVRFVDNINASDCSTSTYCSDIQVSTAGNEAILLGNSSIRFNYDAKVLRYDSYKSVNFNENSTCGNLHPYAEHSFDGLIPGDFLISLVSYNAFADATCSSVLTKDWTTVSTVCFEVLDETKVPNLELIGTQNGTVTNMAGTNFNQKGNDPSQKLPNGTFSSTDKSFEDVCKTTSTESITSLTDGFQIISVQPVPAKDNLMLELNSDKSEDIMIQFFDLTGKTLTEQKQKVNVGPNQFNFDISNFSAGAYMISISKGDAVLAQKFVKE